MEPCPFFSSSIMLWLPWWIVLGFVGYPCASKKYLIHKLDPILSWPQPLWSRLCFIPLPNVMNEPVWLCMSSCTTNASLISHWFWSRWVASNVSHRNSALHNYLITLASFQNHHCLALLLLYTGLIWHIWCQACCGCLPILALLLDCGRAQHWPHLASLNLCMSWKDGRLLK